jgi:hypothetical protein
MPASSMPGRKLEGAEDAVLLLRQGAQSAKKGQLRVQPALPFILLRRKLPGPGYCLLVVDVIVGLGRIGGDHEVREHAAVIVTGEVTDQSIVSWRQQLCYLS